LLQVTDDFLPVYIQYYTGFITWILQKDEFPVAFSAFCIEPQNRQSEPVLKGESPFLTKK